MDNDSWDYHVFWKEVVKQLRNELSEQEFVMWFQNIAYHDAREHEITLAVPSSFYRDQVHQRYSGKIKETLKDLSGSHIDIRFTVDKDLFSRTSSDPSSSDSPAEALSSTGNRTSGKNGGIPPNGSRASFPKETSTSPTQNPAGDSSGPRSGGTGDNRQGESQAPQPDSTAERSTYAHSERGYEKPYSSFDDFGSENAEGSGERRASRSITASTPPRIHPDLNPDYTFDNFVVGDNNVLAANAGIAIGKNPGTAFNPCLIYGGVGLGKTHLIQSIGNYIYSEFDNARVVYVTAETFTNEFIEALRNKKNHQFKNHYRKVDVLLIDDIHFLQSKDMTQEELFHTFNALYDSNKQMVFTCDRPVSELKNLTDRLKSRFERGLNVDLQPPSYETRYAILKSKIEHQNVPIDEDVIELISRNITSHVRDLEAALTKLIAYSNLLEKRITLSIAKEQLRDVFTSPKQNNINSEIIQRVVAEYFGLSPNDLRGKKRTKAIALPRQLAMYITREITELSTTEVGYEFGGRDHTTVMHGCQRVESRKQMDPTLENTIGKLIREIKEQGTKS